MNDFYGMIYAVTIEISFYNLNFSIRIFNSHKSLESLQLQVESIWLTIMQICNLILFDDAKYAFRQVAVITEKPNHRNVFIRSNFYSTAFDLRVFCITRAKQLHIYIDLQIDR